MSTKGEDDAISSLEGYTRYASSRSTAVEPVKPEYSETPIMLSKVHSSQVQGTGIEMERLRTMRLEQTYSEPKYDQRQDNHQQNGNENSGLRTSATEDANLEVDDWANLFSSKKTLTLTRAPSAIPISHVSTSPARIFMSNPTGNRLPPKPPVSISQIAKYRGRASNVEKETTGELAHDADEKRKEVTDEKGLGTEKDEPGVIWVRSFSAQNGGSVFVGKSAAPSFSGILGDDGSVNSTDSQELYAMQQLMGSTDNKNEPISKRQVHSADSQELYAVQQMMAKSADGEKALESITRKRSTQNKSVVSGKDFSIRSKSSDSSGSDAFNGDVNTILADDVTEGQSIGEFSDSDESDSDDEMEEFGNFTVEDMEDVISLDDDADDESQSSDSRSSDETNDNMEIFDAAAEVNSMKISEIQGNKSFSGSEISGSFDEDDEKLALMNTEQDPDDTDGKKKKAVAIEEPTTNKNKKKKKRVFKLATGLGRKKTSAKTVNMQPVAKNKKTKKKQANTKKMKVSKMKSTGIRAPKKKGREKKKGVQLQTIRLNDVDDDLVPKKGDPGVNVMRVCKLTSHGYVAAEFTSIDPNNTPLHIACLTHYPTKFILDHLLKSDTDLAVATENSSGELPIHYAVMDKKGVDPDIFEALIEKFPEGADHRNIDDSLPIHVACQVGAPSLYSIKRLLELNPAFAIEQNDLRVPLEDEEDADDEKEESYGAGCGALLCADWFKEDDNNGQYIRYETGWTPLHLAAVNGAPPDVIEAIVEGDIRCMTIETNKGRTPMECAKSVIINAILNDVPVYKVQNTFNAIEVMQSYEKDIRVKEELALKAGIVNSTLQSQDSYGEWWMKGTELLPNRDKLDEVFKNEKEDNFNEFADDYEDDYWGDEKGMTNLHRAILKKGDADNLHKLLEVSPECMDIVSTADRTPFECAKMLLIRGLLNKDPISTMTNTFIALEIMQAYREEHSHELEEGFNATAALSKANVKDMKTKDRKNWGSRADTYEYTKTFVDMNLSGASLLGKLVTADNDSAVQPFEFFPPPNLKHVNLRINVPVGFRRLRKAILSQRTEFLKIAVYSERLKYKKMKVLPWNKHAKAIGHQRLKKGEKWADFIGAAKTMQYMVPRSEVGGGHMAYETVELLEYNDFCFAFKSIIKTPDLPFGSEYETHCRVIVIDKGINNSRMICSSEMVVTGMSLDDDWQVRNSMRHRATSYFHAIADAVCLHAGWAGNVGAKTK